MRRYVSVEVEVDMSDFDTDDLREELASRGGADLTAGIEVPPLNSEEPHPLHGIYYAMKFGMNEKAHELMRAYVNDQLGTAL